MNRKIFALIVGFLFVGGTFGLLRSAMRPQTFPGDRTEMRTCRWCAGSGVESPDAYEGQPPPGVRPGGPCVGCGGAKQLSVIVPGPNHPAWVKGTVREESKARDLPVETLLMENHEPLKPVVGAIGQAKIRFEKGGETFEIQSAPNGRFKILLPPGHYKVHLSASGFSDRDGELEVAARREPIWNEKAHLKTQEQEADTTVADFLL